MTNKCGCCGGEWNKSPSVAMMLVFMETLRRPYPMIPDDDYVFCINTDCDSAYHFISKAVASSSVVKNSGEWLRCIVVFIDGEGLDVNNNPMLILDGNSQEAKA